MIQDKAANKLAELVGRPVRFDRGETYRGYLMQEKTGIWIILGRTPGEARKTIKYLLEKEQK
jgi:hypothetical protein